MDEKFVWKAEIKFVGTADQFNELMDSIGNAPAEVNIPEWAGRLDHVAGCTPFPIDRILGQEVIKKLTDGMPRLNLKYVSGIDGGMRTAHLHLGDAVVLLDRERFKQYAGEVAQVLAEKRTDASSDYIAVMGAVNSIGDSVPQPIRPRRR
jgi:hypothetical protein